MIQNLHTHTVFCDGKDAPEEMVRAAVALGMDSLGFSGHAPLDGQSGWTMAPEDVPRYRAEILRLREAYAGQLEIFLGLELDAVSIKATTEEGLGFTGAGEGMAAHAVAILIPIEY